MSQWLAQNPYGASSDRAQTPMPVFRDQLDAARSMWYKTPEAQHSDGYLGTIDANRREGRMRSMTNLKTYARGPQAGDQLDPTKYFWTDEVGPTKGIEAQARGERWTQQGHPTNVLSERSGKQQMSGIVNADPRASGYRRFRPPWA